MPEWLGAAIALIYGTVVGSFLNVCIWRMPRDESIAKPASHCPQCNTPLRAWDMVPLISFLVQGRRCRYCKTPISWRYFGVELLTGAYFVFAYYMVVKTGTSAEYVKFLAYALFGASLIAIFFIDLEHYIIPDQLSVFGIVLGVAYDAIGLATGKSDAYMRPYSIPVPGLSSDIPLPQSIVGILVCGGAFLAIAIISYYVFKKEGMGGGDVKLAAAVGAVLGWKLAMLSFFLAVFLGSVIGVGLIVAKKKSRKDYVPFGPMMVAGAVIAMFYGKYIIHAWMVYSGLAG
jgi:leader peptidase (prepilin peptidase) / N-methyltransferase